LVQARRCLSPTRGILGYLVPPSLLGSTKVKLQTRRRQGRFLACTRPYSWINHLTGPSSPVAARQLARSFCTRRPRSLSYPLARASKSLYPPLWHCDSLLVLLSANIPSSTLASQTLHSSFSHQHFAYHCYHHHVLPSSGTEGKHPRTHHCLWNTPILLHRCRPRQAQQACKEPSTRRCHPRQRPRLRPAYTGVPHRASRANPPRARATRECVCVCESRCRG
jgi:hypothetical protein